MKNWLKYIVMIAATAAVAGMIGCGDKNKRDSIPGFNPGWGYPGGGFPGGGGWPGQGPINSLRWNGQLRHTNGTGAYKKFLKDTGVCGNIARSFFCGAIDGGDPRAVLNFDPSLIQTGGGAMGSLTIMPRSSNNFSHGSSITMSGQFRWVSGNSVIRAEQIYGLSYNYNRETTIDLIGDPSSGQLQVVVYYRGKTPAHAVLDGVVRVQQNYWGNGFNNGGNWWGGNTWW